MSKEIFCICLTWLSCCTKSVSYTDGLDPEMSGSQDMLDKILQNCLMDHCAGRNTRILAVGTGIMNQKAAFLVKINRDITRFDIGIQIIGLTSPGI